MENELGKRLYIMLDGSVGNIVSVEPWWNEVQSALLSSHFGEKDVGSLVIEGISKSNWEVVAKIEDRLTKRNYLLYEY